jgi:pimeloyl-ACP methyl ester carboxylesterase
MEVPVVMTVRHHPAAGLTSWADWRETPGVIEPPETRYARSGDLHIAYQVTGEGPRDLLMVPGFVSNVETTWEIPAAAEFLRRLASFSRLILFDKRGTGLSDRVPVSALPSLEARMDDVRAVLDAAGSTRASLFGISEGGPMSVLFAATYPARVDHLVIMAHMPAAATRSRTTARRWSSSSSRSGGPARSSPDAAPAWRPTMISWRFWRASSGSPRRRAPRPH